MTVCDLDPITAANGQEPALSALDRGLYELGVTNHLLSPLLPAPAGRRVDAGVDDDVPVVAPVAYVGLHRSDHSVL